MSKNEFNSKSITKESQKIKREKIAGLIFQEYIELNETSVQSVADYCLVPIDYINMLLEGDIPKSLLEDEFIADLAEFLNMNLEVVRALLEIGDPFKDFDPNEVAIRILKRYKLEAQDLETGLPTEQEVPDTAKQQNKKEGIMSKLSAAFFHHK